MDGHAIHFFRLDQSKCEKQNRHMNERMLPVNRHALLYFAMPIFLDFYGVFVLKPNRGRLDSNDKFVR